MQKITCGRAAAHKHPHTPGTFEFKGMTQFGTLHVKGYSSIGSRDFFLTVKIPHQHQLIEYIKEIR